MRYRHKGMTLQIESTYEAISQTAARMLVAQITLKNDSVIGLPTGSTPEGMYAYLVKMAEEHIVDFRDVVTFNLDEYLNIASDDPQSYTYYMHKHLFDQVNLQAKNTHIPSGTHSNADEVCQAYDISIFQHGKIDMQILGIGNNGHIGFNEPDIKFEAGTHLVTLDAETIRANARFFKTAQEVPKEAISIGIRNIMQAKKVVLIASGEGKAEIVKQMLFGPITPKVPASILQLHNDVTILLDQAAAKEILPLLSIQ